MKGLKFKLILKGEAVFLSVQSVLLFEEWKGRWSYLMSDRKDFGSDKNFKKYSFDCKDNLELPTLQSQTSLCGNTHMKGSY